MHIRTITTLSNDSIVAAANAVSKLIDETDYESNVWYGLNVAFDFYCDELLRRGLDPVALVVCPHD